MCVLSVLCSVGLLLWAYIVFVLALLARNLIWRGVANPCGVPTRCCAMAFWKGHLLIVWCYVRLWEKESDLRR